jgi:uncharacterized protein
VTPPRLLADEMVGTLARYLRMAGCDTAYARGNSDDEIVVRAAAEQRVVVTRDRALAGRLPGSVLLVSTAIGEQVRATWAALPSIPREVRFDRCTRCNGRLEPVPARDRTLEQPGIPWERVDRGLSLYRCEACAHVYWEGTHTESVRKRLRGWVGGAE